MYEYVSMKFYDKNLEYKRGNVYLFDLIFKPRKKLMYLYLYDIESTHILSCLRKICDYIWELRQLINNLPSKQRNEFYHI